jgi:hypothetical protein
MGTYPPYVRTEEHQYHCRTTTIEMVFANTIFTAGYMKDIHDSFYCRFAKQIVGENSIVHIQTDGENHYHFDRWFIIRTIGKKTLSPSVYYSNHV